MGKAHTVTPKGEGDWELCFRKRAWWGILEGLSMRSLQGPSVLRPPFSAGPQQPLPRCDCNLYSALDGALFLCVCVAVGIEPRGALP